MTFKFITVMMNCLGFNGQQGMFLTWTAVWIIKNLGYCFTNCVNVTPTTQFFWGAARIGDVGNGDFGVPSLFQ